MPLRRKLTRIGLTMMVVLGSALPGLLPGLLTGARAQTGDPVGFNVTSTNMDAAIDRLSAVANNRDAQDAALIIATLKAIGRPHGPHLDYRIDVTPEGHVLINQIDVSLIAQMARSMRHK